MPVSKKFLMSQKIEGMKTKNLVMKNVVSLALGDLNTATLGKDELVWLGKPVSEEVFLENCLLKMLKDNQISAEKFVSRGENEKAEPLYKEIAYIQETFFKPLGQEELKEILKVEKEKNPALTKKEWMSFLISNYKGRYNGKIASSLI